MKLIIVLTLPMIAFCYDDNLDINSPYATVKRFTTESDGFEITDIESVVRDAAILKEVYECFLDLSPCEPVLVKIKGHLPYAFAHACVQCTENEKYNLRRFLEELRNQYPQAYRLFKKKYDPFGMNYSKLVKTIRMPIILVKSTRKY